MTDDLLVWWREQLDEDERIAREAPSVLDHGEWPFWVDVDDQEDATATAQYRAHFPPARVLREVEARRKILDLHQPKDGYSPPDDWYGDENKCQTCGGYTLSAGFGDRGYRTPWPCPTLRLLAAPLSDRPGYRQEWAP